MAFMWLLLRNRGFLQLGCLLILSALIPSHAKQGSEMARSDFNWGTEDWEVFGPGKLSIYERAGMLYASDNGRTVWYFSAPEKYLGDKSFAHGGKLKFRLGHSEYMSNGKDMIKDWDVILESKDWRIRIGIKNLIPPWIGASTNDLSLNEKSWTIMKGQGHGHPPTQIQMIRLLSSLSAIYIRGGYYDGHEETWLDSVVLEEGDHHAETLKRKVEKHHHEPLRKKKEEEIEKRKAEEREMLLSAGRGEDGERLPQTPPPALPPKPPSKSPSDLKAEALRAVEAKAAEEAKALEEAAEKAKLLEATVVHDVIEDNTPREEREEVPKIETVQIEVSGSAQDQSLAPVQEETRMQEEARKLRSRPAPDVDPEMAKAMHAAPRFLGDPQDLVLPEGTIVEDAGGDEVSVGAAVPPHQENTRTEQDKAAQEAAELKAKQQAEEEAAAQAAAAAAELKAKQQAEEEAAAQAAAAAEEQRRREEEEKVAAEAEEAHRVREEHEEIRKKAEAEEQAKREEQAARERAEEEMRAAEAKAKEEEERQQAEQEAFRRAQEEEAAEEERKLAEMVRAKAEEEAKRAAQQQEEQEAFRQQQMEEARQEEERLATLQAEAAQKAQEQQANKQEGDTRGQGDAQDEEVVVAGRGGVSVEQPAGQEQVVDAVFI